MFAFKTLYPNCVVVSLLTGTLLSGCGSITGLHADDDFACPLDADIPCQSTTAVYEKSMTGTDSDMRDDEIDRRTAQNTLDNTHAQPTSEMPRTTATPETESKPFDPAIVVTHLTERPQRIPEKIVTIWMAPWTDAEGDFHEGERIYARVVEARWASAHRREESASASRAVVNLPFALGRNEATPQAKRPVVSVTDESAKTTSTVPPTERFGSGAGTLIEEQKQVSSRYSMTGSGQ